MSIIVAICGKARSGKDTTANVIKEHIESKYNQQVRLVSFAYELKKEALKYIGVDTIEELDYYKNNDIKKNGICVRSLLQQLGDSLKVNDSEYFIKKLFNSIDNKFTIITDLRYMNEAHRIKLCRNAYTIKVHRECHSKVGRSLHSSENELDSINCDYNILNDDMEELKISVKEVIEYIISDERDRLMNTLL